MDKLRGSGKLLLVAMGFMAATWVSALVAGTPGSTPVAERGSAGGTAGYATSEPPSGLAALFPGSGSILDLLTSSSPGGAGDEPLTLASFESGQVPDSGGQLALQLSESGGNPGSGGNATNPGDTRTDGPDPGSPGPGGGGAEEPGPPPSTQPPSVWQQQQELARKARETAAEMERQAREARLEAEQRAREAQLEAQQRVREAQLEAERRLREAQLEAQQRVREAQLEAERRLREAQLEAQRRLQNLGASTGGG